MALGVTFALQIEETGAMCAGFFLQRRPSGAIRRTNGSAFILIATQFVYTSHKKGYF
jgi:hypothetical protein